MTNTYNTGNPLGSTDARDLYDNASNMDEGMNSGTPSFTDRLGVLRKTWNGLETEFDLAQTGRETEFQNFLVASGFVSLGNYAAGMNFTLYNQYMARAGFFYRPAPSSIPFTTTGTWVGGDENLFVLLSADDVLRQDLANAIDPAKGAGLVGRSAIFADSVASMLLQIRDDSRVFVVKGYYAGTKVGGGVFYWDAASTEAEDLGTIFQVGGVVTGRFKRIGIATDPVDFGAKGDGITDDSIQMQKWIDQPINLTCKHAFDYRCDTVIFNQVNNRTVDFNFSRIVNETNSKYALISCPNIYSRDEAGVTTLVNTDNYGLEAEGLHVQNLKIKMQAKTISGSNLGAGIVYVVGGSFREVTVEQTNGNGIEVRCSRQIEVINCKSLSARSFSTFIYQCKDYVMRGCTVVGGARGLEIKHANNADPMQNGIIEKNLFVDCTDRYIGGAFSAASGPAPLIPPGHEISRNVLISNNTLTRTDPALVNPSISVGYHADLWVISGNTIESSGTPAGTFITLAGEGTAGYFFGSGHIVSKNKIFGSGTSGTYAIVSACACLIDSNEFYGDALGYLYGLTPIAGNNIIVENPIWVGRKYLSSPGTPREAIRTEGYAQSRVVGGRLDLTLLENPGGAGFSLGQGISLSGKSWVDSVKVSISQTDAAAVSTTVIRCISSTGVDVVTDNLTIMSTDGDVQMYGVLCANATARVGQNTITVTGIGTSTVVRGIQKPTAASEYNNVFEGAFTATVFNT